MLKKLSKFWDKLKACFKYSETIFIARLTAFSGFLTAVIAGLDWERLINMDWGSGFSNKQLLALGLAMLAQGIITEVARRRNANL